MKHIFLSAGHNPEKTGASWGNLKEYNITKEWIDIIHSIVWDIKNSNIACHKVPTGTLTQKVNFINSYVRLLRECEVNPDFLAIELHFNSAGTTYVEGCETLYYPSIENKEKAKLYHDSFIKIMKVKDRGVKEGWYKLDKPGHVDYKGDVDGDEVIDYFLRSTYSRSLILEPYFMCQLDNVDKTDACRAIAESLLKTI